MKEKSLNQLIDSSAEVKIKSMSMKKKLRSGEIESLIGVLVAPSLFFY